DRFGAPMTLHYRAAVLHRPHSPLQIETIAAAPIAPSDVLVRVRAAGLCHTDLEVIDGSLRYPMPAINRRRDRGSGSRRAAAEKGRSRHPVVEPALRPLLVLRPRPPQPWTGLAWMATAHIRIMNTCCSPRSNRARGCCRV